MSQNRSLSGLGRSPFAPVSRPSFHVWQPIEAEGIRWEGQVLLVGEQSDLPALMVVTSERLVMVANDAITLEFPKAWLKPAPRMVAENGVRLNIAPDGNPANSTPVMIRAREGRGSAMALIGLLGGSTRANGIAVPNWQEKVGASRAVALPPIDATEPNRKQQAAWPPVEQQGVAKRPSQPTNAPIKGTPRPSADIVPWRQGSAGNAPAPVPVAVSRAATRQGTRNDGRTVRDDVPMPGTLPHNPERPARRRTGAGPIDWLFRVALLAMLVGSGFAAQRQFDITLDDVRAQIPTSVQKSLGIKDDSVTRDVAVQDAPQGVAPGASDGTDGSDVGAQPSIKPTDAPTSEPVSTEEGGRGGLTGELPPTGDAVTPEPTSAPTDVPAVEPTLEPTTAPEIEPTLEPTVAPTLEPTVAPTDVPATEEPTVAPTTEPTVEPTATVQPTIEATSTATAAPTATIGDPTAPLQPTATVEPTQGPSIEPQAPSVEPSATPQQAIQADGFRYTIQGASVGSTVPELPEINSVEGSGQWVVLNVYGQNMTTADQTFDMSRFVLYADGQAIPLDDGNAWVNKLMGHTPAYGPADAMPWAAGEGHAVTLTFLAPAGAQQLVLQTGSQAIDLAPALNNAQPLKANSAAPKDSELLEGTVTKVIDGETIVVNVKGTEQTVRYLGLDTPTGSECSAQQATETNTTLMSGKKVLIERQSTDTDAKGNWVRDVWVINDDGSQTLASQHLVSKGVAKAGISEPNSRWAGWLTATENVARQNSTGVWGQCGGQ